MAGDLDHLYGKRAVANDGPRMKRIRPAPMGRAYRYVRRISHIEIALAERGKNGREDVVTVVGEEQKSAKAPRKAAPKAKVKKKKTEIGRASCREREESTVGGV